MNAAMSATIVIGWHSFIGHGPTIGEYRVGSKRMCLVWAQVCRQHGRRRQELGETRRTLTRGSVGAHRERGRDGRVEAAVVAVLAVLAGVAAVQASEDRQGVCVFQLGALDAAAAAVAVTAVSVGVATFSIHPALMVDVMVEGTLTKGKDLRACA